MVHPRGRIVCPRCNDPATVPIGTHTAYCLKCMSDRVPSAPTCKKVIPMDKGSFCFGVLIGWIGMLLAFWIWNS